MSELIDPEDARRLVLERARPLADEAVPLDDALGRILAADISSAAPVPGFDNSAMDGYAVRAANSAPATGAAPVRLRVVGESRAGHPANVTLGEGEAIAISTGAMLPGGADAVVRVEDTDAADGVVAVLAAVDPGANVRPAGEDIEAGETVLRRGTAVGPAELGVLASVGAERVRCVRRPRVRIVLSGDELAPPGERLAPGQIHDSNAYTLPALAGEAGSELAGAAKVGDDPAATREAIRAGLDADLLVISGGMSVGRHDHVRPALADLGAEEVFWGVALRPGKPTWFGAHPGGALIVGLPGNPVSAVVCFILFARPAILAMQGAAPDRDRTEATLATGYEKRPGRMHAVRCRLRLDSGGWLAEPTGPQGSHILTSMLGADALALVPRDRGTVAAGERVEVELLPRGLRSVR
jgi:molybdopterin molybdotransferase